MELEISKENLKAVLDWKSLSLKIPKIEKEQI